MTKLHSMTFFTNVKDLAFVISSYLTLGLSIFITILKLSDILIFMMECKKVQSGSILKKTKIRLPVSSARLFCLIKVRFESLYMFRYLDNSLTFSKFEHKLT